MVKPTPRDILSWVCVTACALDLLVRPGLTLITNKPMPALDSMQLTFIGCVVGVRCIERVANALKKN